ncbi:spore coat protein CotH [Filibacter limicola]|uniref:Spore coat protein CotH n=1 Tax=Sporosarcina limicola TaxID=34101 RepID=A0A927RGB0_9BACL|nr:spore coat protein CotH [Sporosarcina limicola]
MNKGMKIPKYQLFIHPLDLSEIRKDIWIDDSVPAKLTINEKKFDIDIAYRGSHIRDFRKNHFKYRFINRVRIER